jgi:hypothetical protein
VEEQVPLNPPSIEQKPKGLILGAYTYAPTIEKGTSNSPLLHPLMRKNNRRNTKKKNGKK